MGNRVSISFKNGKEESVVLFSHWDGKKLVKKAKEYIKELKDLIEFNSLKVSTPLNRLEPNIIMINFIRYLTKDLDRVESNYYLGKDKDDGDNSDNGHFVIKL